MYRHEIHKALCAALRELAIMRGKMPKRSTCLGFVSVLLFPAWRWYLKPIIWMVGNVSLALTTYVYGWHRSGLLVNSFRYMESGISRRYTIGPGEWQFSSHGIDTWQKTNDGPFRTTPAKLCRRTTLNGRMHVNRFEVARCQVRIRHSANVEESFPIWSPYRPSWIYAHCQISPKLPLWKPS